VGLYRVIPYQNKNSLTHGCNTILLRPYIRLDQHYNKNRLQLIMALLVIDLVTPTASATAKILLFIKKAAEAIDIESL